MNRSLGHGNRTRYNKGCRCLLCSEAHRIYQRAYMAAWRAAHPLMHEVDDAAVERACSGDRSVSLNRAEMATAFQLLNADGYSAALIADRLGVAERTVVRWRSRRTALPLGRVA